MPGQGGGDTDLISLLTNQVKESRYLEEAYALIDEVKGAPTCNQLAAYQLLTSCKTLEVGTDGTESPVLLERVKNLYAARLAVCELQSAHAVIPAQCKEVMSISLGDLASEDQPRLNRLWYGQDRVDAKVLQPCLKALHDRSTSWTSYSNNRAQAITMCHAIRDHLEREQTAETHRKLVKVVSKMTDETSEVSKMLSETQQRHAATHLEIQELFKDFISEVSAELGIFSQRGIEVVDLLSDITISVTSLNHDLQTMSAKAKNASNDVDMVRHRVSGILKPVVEASSEISSHLVDMKDFMELAKPFLAQGTHMAHAVNDGWRKVQATHKLLLEAVPKLGMLLFLTLIGRFAGIQKRRILLVISALAYGSYAVSTILNTLFFATSTFVDSISTVPDWVRANDDVLAVSGLVIIAITFATISYFWLDGISHARMDLRIKQERKSLQAVRRHDRHKNLAVDLGSSKHYQETERDRFKRAETVPPQFFKSEWV
jgi:hypothetical protein